MHQVTVEIDEGILYRGQHASINGDLSFSAVSDGGEWVLGPLIDISVAVYMGGEQVENVMDELTLDRYLTIRQMKMILEQASEKVEGLAVGDATGTMF